MENYPKIYSCILIQCKSHRTTRYVVFMHIIAVFEKNQYKYLKLNNGTTDLKVLINNN